MAFNKRLLAPVVLRSRGGAAVPSTLLTGLVAYWKLDESSGNRADSIGSSTLVDSGTVPAVVAVISNGIRTAALKSLSCASNAALSTGDIDFTIALWVKLKDREGDHFILAKDNLSDAREYGLFYYDTAGLFYFAVYNGSAAVGAIQATTFGEPTIDQWYFVVCWHNAATNKIGISVNNGDANTGDTTGAPVAGTAALTIGYRGASAVTANEIDEIGIWKRILTADEITALYNGGSGNTYPFDGNYVSSLPIDYDVFMVAGQSNASGRGTNSQTFTKTGEYNSFVFGNDYSYHDMVDPVDSISGQIDAVSQEPVAPPSGSVWPILATGLSAVGRKTVFVPCAIGGSAIASWQPGANHQDRTTLYGSMVYRALQVQAAGGVLRGVLWWQGESNAGLTQAAYNTALDTIANAINADLGIPLIPQTLQICGGIDVSNVNAAIVEAWGDNANVKTGPDISDIEHDDNVWDGTTYHVHICSDEKLAIVGNRWVTAIRSIFSW